MPCSKNSMLVFCFLCLEYMLPTRFLFACLKRFIQEAVTWDAHYDPLEGLAFHIEIFNYRMHGHCCEFHNYNNLKVRKFFVWFVIGAVVLFLIWETINGFSFWKTSDLHIFILSSSFHVAVIFRIWLESCHLQNDCRPFSFVLQGVCLHCDFIWFSWWILWTFLTNIFFFITQACLIFCQLI